MQEQASSRERTHRVERTAITGVTCAGSLLSQINQGDPTQKRGGSYSLMKILLHSSPAFIVVGDITQMETITKRNQSGYRESDYCKTETNYLNLL
jgi:hypothetical protein